MRIRVTYIDILYLSSIDPTHPFTHTPQKNHSGVGQGPAGVGRRHADGAAAQRRHEPPGGLLVRWIDVHINMYVCITYIVCFWGGVCIGGVAWGGVGVDQRGLLLLWR